MNEKSGTFSPVSDASKNLRLKALASLFSISGPIHIVDVGANPIGAAVSYQNLLEGGHARVTGFEPQAEALDQLNRQKSRYEIYHPQVLGDGSTVELHICRGSGLTSVFRGNRSSGKFLQLGWGMKILKSETHQTHRLDDLEDIPPIDFLKIDVQGSELAVIANAASKLSHAVAIQTEVRLFPLYHDEPLYGDLERELLSQEFLLHKFHDVKSAAPTSRHKNRIQRRNFTQLIDSDAFFVRDARRIGDYTDQQLAKLAILADSVMESFDLCLYCLEALTARGLFDNFQVEQYLATLPNGALKT